MAKRKIRIETPRGALYHDKNMKAVLEWNTAEFVPRWTRKFSAVQEYVDGIVLDLSEPFVPLDTSMLKRSGDLGTVIGSGMVRWIAPYARFQYYGKVMIGEHSRSAWAKRGERKVVTEKKLTYHGGGERGSFWFERMKAAHKPQIIEGARRVMRETR
jgi:hypothetical protein